VAARPAPVGRFGRVAVRLPAGGGKDLDTDGDLPGSSATPIFFRRAERAAHVFEVLIGKMGKDRDVDAVLRKWAGALGQTEPCKAIGYFLHRRPRPDLILALWTPRSFSAKPTKTVARRGRVTG
jgi:hypothetical protein